MFSERIDSHITMLQRMVALFRDLILGVVLVITSLIVYLGGDSSKLTVLDWTKLVAAAGLIVIGPLLIFLVIKLVARLIAIITQPHLYFLYGGNIPKSFYVWVFMKYGMSKREYVEFWWKRRGIAKRLAIRKPRTYKMFVNIARVNKAVDEFTSRWYPYLLAVFSLGLFIAVFVKRYCNTYHSNKNRKPRFRPGALKVGRKHSASQWLLSSPQQPIPD